MKLNNQFSDIDANLESLVKSSSSDLAKDVVLSQKINSSEKIINSSILESICKRNLEISICTVNNKDLRGKIVDFDSEMIVLEYNQRNIFCMRNNIVYLQILEYTACVSKDGFYTIKEQDKNYLVPDITDISTNDKNSLDIDFIDFSKHLYVSN